MIVPMPNLMVALPEIFVLVMACVILLVDLWVKENRFIAYALTQMTLLFAAWLTLGSFHRQVEFSFSHMFVADAISDTLKLMTYVAVSVTLVYARAYIGLRGLYRGEFFVLALFAMLGMMVMISANHFLVLYLGLELLSLSLYAMVAMKRDSPQATEAAMKYFILGALASGLLLYGMSLIYGATGSLYNNEVALAIMQGVESKALLAMGVVFVVAGLAFKLGAAPFHMWVPDVYHGSPTAVTLFLGTAPKLAAFAFTMRLLIEGLQGSVADWQGMLVVLSVVSMLVGNLAAIAQTNIKRMLAYSTISHMGFLLLGILSGSLGGFAAAMFYVVAYVLMSLGAFGIILLLGREGFEADQLDDFKGLNKRNPWVAFLMLLIMISMAGVPVSVGFFAKLSVLSAVLDAGMTWLVVVAVLMSLIGAFYYLRVIKLMYMDEPEDTAPIVAEADHRILIGLNALAVLVLGILPQPLIDLCLASITQSMRG